MILSTDWAEHEYKEAGAHMFDCTIDGVRCNYVRRVDSKQLTYDVYDAATLKVTREKARYVGIFLGTLKVEILPARPKPEAVNE